MLRPALDPDALSSQYLTVWTVQRAETGNSSGFLFTLPHVPLALAKIMGQTGLCHPATSHNGHKTEKAGSWEKLKETKCLWDCQAGKWESWDLPPALQLDQESILPLRVIVLIIRWASGLQNPLIFALSSEREEFWLSVPSLGWLKMTVWIDALGSVPAHCLSPHCLFALSKSAPNKFHALWGLVFNNVTNVY